MLLVRLQTAQRKIDALEQMGKEEQANEVKNEQYRENKESILAFKQAFEFCPVYFFYADKSGDIRKGNLSENLFDSELNIIQDTSELKDFYLVGEFAETPNLGIDGFVLMASDLIPLQAPFPFYQREHIFFGLVSISKGKIIENLNAKLFNTYELWFPNEQ